MLICEDRAGLAGGIEHQDVSGQGVRLPPSGRSVQDQARQDRHGEDAVDQGDPPFGAQDRIVQGRAGAAFPAARLNITAAVTAVQMIPAGLWPAR